VSESLTATLNNLAVAGTQIDAVRAGGDATTVSGISLNLTGQLAGVTIPYSWILR
jgi:hypothetical protein